MLTFYCPHCWERIEGNMDYCPKCGFNLADYKKLSYENKLIQSLNHPLPGRRNIAAQVLGNINSIKALKEFEKILRSGNTDYFFLRVILYAIAKIESPERIKLLELAQTNSNIMIKELATTLIKIVNEHQPIPEWDHGTG